MKQYICSVITHDPFVGSKTKYYCLGNKALEAYTRWKEIQHYDYDFGETSSYRDSYRHTLLMWKIEEPEKISNPHNFFTPVNDRIHSIPVYGWDGSIIDRVKTTVNECLQNAPAMQENGWIYDVINDCIKTMEYRLTIVDNQFEFVEVCNESNFPF